jgi:hypothetical protein
VVNRLDDLDQARRTEHGTAGLAVSTFLAGAPFFARPLRCGMLREHVAAGQRDAALAGDTLDERSRHHFFDRARRALQFDAVIALQQREHFLARRVEQFRDLVNPNRCQIESFALVLFLDCGLFGRSSCLFASARACRLGSAASAGLLPLSPRCRGTAHPSAPGVHFASLEDAELRFDSRRFSSSLLMSMRQPVSLAASRTF